MSGFENIQEWSRETHLTSSEARRLLHMVKSLRSKNKVMRTALESIESRCLFYAKRTASKALQETSVKTI